MTQTAELWAPGSTAQEGATEAQVRVQRDALKKAHERIASIKFNCEHCTRFFTDECKLHGPIPRDFIKAESGCPDWRYDGIPF